MMKRCTICNSRCATIAFRGGRICKNCLNYVITRY